VDEIAEKKKHLDGGYYWDIKPDARVNLELLDLAMVLPVRKSGLDIFATAQTTTALNLGERFAQANSSHKRKASGDGRTSLSTSPAQDVQLAVADTPKKYKTTLASANLLLSHLIKKKKS
jgi:hypothetical protein